MSLWSIACNMCLFRARRLSKSEIRVKACNCLFVKAQRSRSRDTSFPMQLCFFGVSSHAVRQWWGNKRKRYLLKWKKEKVRPSWYILNAVYDTNNGLIVDGFIFSWIMMGWLISSHRTFNKLLLCSNFLQVQTRSLRFVADRYACTFTLCFDYNQYHDHDAFKLAISLRSCSATSIYIMQSQLLWIDPGTLGGFFNCYLLPLFNCELYLAV